MSWTDTRSKIPKSEKFCYVDFAARYQPGFRNHVVHVDEIPDLINRYHALECYTTYFLFKKDLLDYLKERGSVSGFDGQAFAYFLPLDIDAPKLEQALESVKRIVLFLIEDWEVSSEAIQCWFSGRKGFHILINVGVFGDVRPSKKLHYIFSRIREMISKDAKVKLDLSIKDKMRLLRLPNTMHQKSGLYKIPLSIHEVRGLSAAKILKCAREPRPLINIDGSGLLPQIEIPEGIKASRIFRKAHSLTREQRRKVVIDTSLRDETLKPVPYIWI